MSRDLRSRPTLLLGRDYPEFGLVESLVPGDGRTACAISAGADPASPAMLSKGDPRAPNEDALLVIDEKRFLLMAVADAHHGLEASHRLVEGLAAGNSIPPSLGGLEETLAAIRASDAADLSASTLLAAVFDRERQSGFGISFGDSSVTLVSARGARTLNTRNTDYVRMRDPSSYQPGRGLPFHFHTRPGQLLVAFTDGINECHYRSPATSVRRHHLEKLFDETGPEPAQYAERLMRLALDGVDGNPGGQDNVALIVTRTELR